MELTIQHAFLPHTDPDASLDFYRDLLGFEVLDDVGYNGMRWITFGRPGQQTTLVVQPPDADPGITDEERRVIAEMMAKGTFGIIVFNTDDLDGLFAKLESRGAEIVQEPIDQPYGVRDCALRDPAGNMVRIQQRT